MQVVGSEPGQVVILRALQLGDMLCAVPAFRAMRAGWPAARITLVGLPWARGIVERFGRYLDDFVQFPGYPGLPERPPDPAGLTDFLATIQRRRYDLALQLHGDGSITNGLVARFGAGRIAGFHPAGTVAPSVGHYVEYREDLHEIRRLLLLVERLGLESRGEYLEFPLNAGDEEGWKALREAVGVTPGTYACLHPGARAESRRWPPRCFADLACWLASIGLRVLVTGFGAEEERLAAEVVGAAGGHATSVAGELPLGVLAALVRDARLLVCNDTGVSHLSAAVRTPSVTIFRITDPRRWAPLDGTLHRVVRDGPGAVAQAVEASRELLAERGTRCAS